MKRRLVILGSSSADSYEIPTKIIDREDLGSVYDYFSEADVNKLVTTFQKIILEYFTPEQCNDYNFSIEVRMFPYALDREHVNTGDTLYDTPTMFASLRSRWRSESQDIYNIYMQWIPGQPDIFPISFVYLSNALPEYKYQCEKLYNKYLKDTQPKSTSSKGDNMVKLHVEYYPYDRYGGDERLHKANVSGVDELDALINMVGRMGLYLIPEEIEEEGYTFDECINSILESNGDGCDLITLLKNVNTGEVYIKDDYEPDEEEW